jgi:hypothetical protein
LKHVASYSVAAKDLLVRSRDLRREELEQPTKEATLDLAA